MIDRALATNFKLKVLEHKLTILGLKAIAFGFYEEFKKNSRKSGAAGQRRSTWERAVTANLLLVLLPTLTLLFGVSYHAS